MHQRSVQELFREAAARFPEHVAVDRAGERTTYRALDERANGIARLLVEAGVAKGSSVAILAERPAEVVASIVGVLRAGGVFVPLDPGAPAHRLASMAGEAAPAVYLAEERFLGVVERLLEGGAGAGVAPLDGDGTQAGPAVRAALIPGLAGRSDASGPGVEMEGDDPCYLYFTSGSTGTPKAIVGRLRGIDHFIDWEVRNFGVGEGTRVSQLTSPSFDASLRDYFVPLCAGGTVCVPDDRATLLDPAALVRWLERERVALVHCVPSLFRALSQQELTPESLPDLERVLMAGEPLPPADVKRWMDVFGDRVELVNLYGPSETTMVKFFHRVRREDADRPSIPVGRPMEGARAVVVGEDGRVCPPGAVGEIWIRTPFRTLGYHGQPELTAQAFVLNPFVPDPDPSDLVYRTGDLGRVLEDGNFEILGRRDLQIKLRGMRIEPGEVENALRSHPAVSDVVVVDRVDARGDKFLCAYLVAEDGLSGAALREHLSDRLPEALIPAVFSRLVALPRTTTGKVDRAALPEPEPMEAGSRVEYVAPRTPAEEQLERIWARVLGVEKVGINDNFFELGGHSLLAPRLVAQVRSAFSIDVPLVRLFESPTVAGLAAALEEFRGERPLDVALPEILPDHARRGEPFPLTDVQQAYWVGRTGAFELGNVATHTYLELESRDMSAERFAVAWRRLVERHDMLRAIVLPDGQQQILLSVPEYQVETLDLRGQDPETVEARLAEIRDAMSHEVLPSDQWPLFRLRTTLLDDRVRFHLSYDLLISDAHSNRILNREFLHYYNHPDQPLPPLELSFRDYVLGDQALRDTELYRRSWDYWQKRLDTLPPAPELPLACDPGEVVTPRFAHRAARFERARWSRIKQRGARAGITPSGIVLAVLAEVLGTWSRSPRFCINCTLYNRFPMHPQVNDIVGDFTSVTILEVDRSRPESFEQRARRMQGQLWNDLEHRYMSGVQVIRQLQARRSGTRRALYPVVFTSTLIHDVNRKVGPSLATMAEQVYRSSQTSQVWLDNVVREEDGALWVRWNAIEDLFQPGMLEEMFAAFCGLMDRLSDESTWEESSLGLVPAAHLARHAEANRTDAPYPEALLHELFAARAAEAPGRTAVAAPDRTLTYGELDALSNRIARRLRGLGAGPGRLVAVVMEKGWEQVAAVLGILKAGAAYLPVDATLPRERLWLLLENGDARVALTQSRLDGTLEWPEGLVRLAVDAEAWTDSAEPLETVQSQDDLAYVIYTSGSTGSPKGAMLAHRGVVNRVADVNRRFGVGPADRVIALTALHHDLSVYDLFGALAAGAALVVPDAERVRDPQHWLEISHRHGVTLWNSVPAFMEMLVEHARSAGAGTLPASLRLVMLSGDWVPVALPDRIRALGENARVVSLGGPTETTVWDVCYPVGEVDPAWKSIPYGRPMLNHRYHVLDEVMEPRPDWVPGELYAAGVGLARGYWRDEARTAERFVTHPRTGERLYRTGDVGRWLPDGNLEFVGRADFQIKIQGWRIEPGEIEAALAEHPAVRQAVVTALDGAGGKRLVAYVARAAEDAVPSTEAASVAERGTALLDPVERLRFKLRKPGVRHEPGRPSLALADGELDTAPYVSRRAYRTFREDAIPFASFSEFLGVLRPARLEGFPLLKYRFASAGGLYPVQTYLYVKPGRVQGVEGGTYYYDATEHRLRALDTGARFTHQHYKPTNRAVFEASAFSVFFVGEMSAIRPVYGDAGRDFCMIEAGLVASLLESASVEHDIGLCHVGGLNFDRIRPSLELGDTHEYLYGLVGGAIDPAQATLAGLVSESDELHAALEILRSQPDAPVAAAPTGPRTLSDSQLAAELRAVLSRKLPQYMVPSAVVVLEQLPLTANGKVDRRALPEPGAGAVEAQQQRYVPPATEVERIIAGVWQEVLDVEKVGVRDNFFDLGGNSVKLIRTHVKLRERLEGELPIVQMFQNPTVGALAEFLSRETPEPAPAEDFDDRVARQREAQQRARRLVHADDL